MNAETSALRAVEGNEPTLSEMQARLDAQRAAYLAEGPVSLAVRKDRLSRGSAVLVKYKEQIAEALDADFGCRPRELSLLTDVVGTLGAFHYAQKNLKKWMKPQKRSTMFPMNLLGGKSQVRYQPKGVVGIMSPWNFPVNLIFSPLAGVLAAGNRAMIKPSEYTPATSDLVAQMVAEAFDENEVAVFTGGPEAGAAFSGLAFDHLVFTGATSIAKHIMAAASQNLVPLTLELGGKSPVIISRGADIKQAVSRVMLGKTMNAGQICLAPDYLLVPEELLDTVVAEIKSSVAEMFPTILDNKQYTAIVNERHYQRLTGWLEEAKAAGANVVEINPANEDFSNQSGSLKIPPTLIINPDENLKVMQDELFGPVLPIKTYKTFDDSINYINSRPRPLGLYYFGKDKAEENAVLDRTTSGGVCFNDVISHIMQDDMPFGGIGPAGMGHYHGKEGFIEFSHVKSVYRQTGIDVHGIAGMRPPYGPKTESTIKMQAK